MNIGKILKEQCCYLYSGINSKFFWNKISIKLIYILIQPEKFCTIARDRDVKKIYLMYEYTKSCKNISSIDSYIMSTKRSEILRRAVFYFSRVKCPKSFTLRFEWKILNSVMHTLSKAFRYFMEELRFFSAKKSWILLLYCTLYHILYLLSVILFLRSKTSLLKHPEV